MDQSGYTPSRSSTNPTFGSLCAPGRVEIRSNKETFSDFDQLSPRPVALGPPSAGARMDPVTPPLTPIKSVDQRPKHIPIADPDILAYNFSRIDYEIERAKIIGTGLWSSVFLAQPRGQSPEPIPTGSLTPPRTPSHKSSSLPCSLYAVKSPARPDSKEVLLQEARILTRLQTRIDASAFVVPFYGLDSRHGSLVFEAVLGGSLEDLLRRLKQMTEVARHLEFVALFSRLARDLIGGLAFLHEAGVIHADIKPANILLDISEQSSTTRPLIRARYIDFSASFVSGSPESVANAGGTWDYMAPEQLRVQKDLNTPTHASDVWSLGMTLLTLVVGGSPYAAACGDNMFRRREAIKAGDPLSYARLDPVVQKRMAACQDFIDGLKMALQKDRERRPSAQAWLPRFEDF